MLMATIPDYDLEEIGELNTVDDIKDFLKI
jgi:hypothetical protein